LKGITSETQIKALHIPEAQKIELLKQFNQGASIKSIEYKIKGANAEDISIIQKGIPRQNIKFVEVTGQSGNVINRIAVGKVKVGKGAVNFKEDVLTLGRGTTAKGISDVESIAITSQKGKITSGLKTRDISKAKVRDVEGLKVIEARTKTFEGMKIKSNSRKTN